MTEKSTATMLQLATPDGEKSQQIIMFPSKAVFRRSIEGSTRTRWRYAGVGDLSTWVTGYINLTKVAPTPMDVSLGPVLMEVTEDESDEATGGSLARNVGLRYTRVLDAMATDPLDSGLTVEDFVKAWENANVSDDNAWIDRHIHPAGTARPAPAAAPAPDPDPEPEAEPEPDPAAVHGWTYQPIKAGYVTRPNGERYKVRMIEGVPDVTMMRDSRVHREHVLLTGEPGTGKTAMIDSAFGRDLVTMLGTEDTEVSDFIGSYVATGNPDRPHQWVDGALVEAMERGVPLFIDEVGVIAPKVMTTTFSVMDGRDEILITANPSRGTITAQPGFMVLAATNPKAPGVRLSEALLSRFALHMEVGTDYEAMRAMGVPTELVQAAENLEKRRKANDISYAPQARELLRASQQYKTRGEAIALRNMISSAPEDDRWAVIEVLKRVTGKKLEGLSI